MTLTALDDSSMNADPPVSAMNEGSEAEKEGFEPSRQGFPHLTP